MNTYRNTTLAACGLLMLGACASGPVSISLLEQARLDYAQAQRNPKIATYAAPEMQAASHAMAVANNAAAQHESPGEMDRLAYLAKRKIARANQVASRKATEFGIAAAAGMRNKVSVEQRPFEEQLTPLAAKRTDRGLVINFGDVLFGTDLSRLNAQGMEMAQRLADVLKTNPARTVLVGGFTDNTGTSEHNQALSERRATAVRNVLLELGVASERVAMRGYGESMPVAANDTAQNRQLNRRVEIVLSDERGVIARR